MNKRKSSEEDRERYASTTDSSKKQRIETAQKPHKAMSTRIRKLPPPPTHPTVHGRASSVASTSKPKEVNVINISRKKSTMGYIRRIQQLVLDKGFNKIHLHALSAAIPFTLTLIPILRQHFGNSVRFSTRTSTVTVVDEVIPTNKEDDIRTQNRNQSAVRITMLVNGEPDDEDSESEHKTHAETPLHKTKNRGIKRRLKDEQKREERERNKNKADATHKPDNQPSS
ncbi:hypothetical protein E3P99_02226 [Wallemia hederae]|uniref:DNA/RNA-binding protein Alba-like domain-containing protein n=1 Tax=Wallemia hederae TaxID=1540922 RepID=A0A4T0FLB0_9BASI|nr:hypothetical protein E3P99_02226 [Wallemia hederae]